MSGTRPKGPEKPNESLARRAPKYLILVMFFITALLSPCLGQAEDAERPQSAAALVTSQGSVVRYSNGHKVTRGEERKGRSAVAEPSSLTVRGRAKAVDPVTVTAQKICTGIDCTVLMSWTGNTSPVTIVSASEPTFQHDVETIEWEYSMPNLTAPIDTSTDRYMDISDENVVNRATQGIGYDPLPRPRVTAVSGGAWWGDTVTATGAYLDAITPSNLTFFYGRSARATSVNDLGNGFADQATFSIPADARTSYVRVLSNGHSSVASSASFVPLYPAGIDPYSAIHGVSWAPQTGNIWVGADGQVDEIDLFKREPVCTTRASGLTKVYLSRVTSTGELVFVDGVAGVTEVSVVDVTTGAVQQYALTTDSEFTRSIQPVGIGVAYDGTACFIADASAARVVKIPRGNATDISDTYGNYTGWSFPDPCNMDTSTSGLLYVPDANAVRGVTPTYTYVDIWITGIRGILMDREASTDGTNRYFMTIEAGHAEVFNLNPIEYGSGPPYSESPARYLGGIVWGLDDGRLRLDQDWYYGFQRQTPQKVLLTNVRPEWPYQSPDQTVDHVIKLEVEGWYGVPLKLRLVDPPDLAPYDAKSLDDPTGYTEFPYHAGDNVYPSTDYGLTLNADGSDPHQELTAVPNATNILTFYLKVPPDVSGNNFQVQVIKCDADTGTPVPERMVSISPVYTTWKRIFVERDRMFKRGALLAKDFNPETCGYGGVEPECNQVIVFDWAPVAPGDEVVLFQNDRTAEDALLGSMNGGIIAFITDVSELPEPYTNSVRVTLDVNLAEQGIFWKASSDQPALPGETATIDFGLGNSAGLGVVGFCDTALNILNESSSCFYHGDMRGIEKALGDAYTEVYGSSSGSTAVPFLDSSVDLTELSTEFEFSQMWFENSGALINELPPETTPNNIFHLIPAGDTVGDSAGFSFSLANYTYVMIGWINEYYNGHATAEEITNIEQWAFVHETGHYFWVNPCTGGYPPIGHRDENAWCGSPGGECADYGVGREAAVMYIPDSGNYLEPDYLAMISNEVFRFSCSDLNGSSDTDPPCGESPCVGEIGIRAWTDPE